MTGNDVMGTGSHVFLGGETAEQWEKTIVGSWNRKSRVFEWETADQCEKRIVGSCNRKSRDLEWETADQSEKWIVGSGWAKTAEKTRAQSPKSNWSSGGRYKKATTMG